MYCHCASAMGGRAAVARTLGCACAECGGAHPNVDVMQGISEV